MKLVFSKQAEIGLNQIADYIAQDNPRRALTFVRELRQISFGLLDAPLGYPLLLGFEHKGIRKRPFRDYLILYRVMSQQIDILHILHAARDYTELLEDRASE